MRARGVISLLLLFFLSSATAAVVTAWFQARAEVRANPADLYAAVDGQLDDIRRQNFPGAYERASSGIRQQFTEKQFAEMVRLDYPCVMALGQTEYGAIEAAGRRAEMRVYFIDRNGLVLPCLYRLVREGGQWRIDGASIQQPWPPAVKMAGTML